MGPIPDRPLCADEGRIAAVSREAVRATAIDAIA